MFLYCLTPFQYMSTEPPGSRLPLHLASVTHAPTLQHISDRINLISAQHNLAAPNRNVAHLLMLAFEVCRTVYSLQTCSQCSVPAFPVQTQTAHNRSPLNDIHFTCYNLNQAVFTPFIHKPSLSQLIQHSFHHIPRDATLQIRCSYALSPWRE